MAQAEQGEPPAQAEQEELLHSAHFYPLTAVVVEVLLAVVPEDQAEVEAAEMVEMAHSSAVVAAAPETVEMAAPMEAEAEARKPMMAVKAVLMAAEVAGVPAPITLRDQEGLKEPTVEKVETER